MRPAFTAAARALSENRLFWEAPHSAVYFSFFALLLCRRLWDDLSAFRGAAAGFALQFAVALVVFWIFPSRMERPEFDPIGLSRSIFKSKDEPEVAVGRGLSFWPLFLSVNGGGQSG
ncbi:MAG TPA: hypothetical protein VNK24_07285 [Elusimicrobiota bacterium]|nr:hypothetical protein [Elusimicrobiota bacterium]